jgi:hypothetical protein
MRIPEIGDAKMRCTTWIVSISALAHVSCASVPDDKRELFNGHELTYLTLTLAENTTQLAVLRELHAGNRDAAIEMLQFEQDARILFLAEILDQYPDHTVVKEKASLIACHLRAIAKYRKEHGVQEQYPEVAEMASKALEDAPGCDCSKRDPGQLASRSSATSDCS